MSPQLQLQIIGHLNMSKFCSHPKTKKIEESGNVETCFYLVVNKILLHFIRSFYHSDSGHSYILLAMPFIFSYVTKL